MQLSGSRSSVGLASRSRRRHAAAAAAAPSSGLQLQQQQQQQQQHRLVKQQQQQQQQQRRRSATAAAAAAPTTRPAAAGRAVALRVAAHAGGGAKVASQQQSELKKTGFVGEMRAIAMKMHTKEQAPKEGGLEAPKPKAFAPTLAGYQQFLAESKAVYDAFEDVLRDEAHPEYARFQNTGLERSAALAADLAWFREAHPELPPPVVADDGPGMTYAKHLRQLAATDPQYFICHYYNYYFAHTAGGRMIGAKVAEMLLAGKQLRFYEYPEGADVGALLDGVRASLNALAEGWTREQKDHCLRETADAFQYSGTVMRCMTEEPRGA